MVGSICRGCMCLLYGGYNLFLHFYIGSTSPTPVCLCLLVVIGNSLVTNARKIHADV